MSTLRLVLITALMLMIPSGGGAQQSSTKGTQQGAVVSGPGAPGSTLADRKTVLPTTEELIKRGPKVAVNIAAEEMGMVRLPERVTTALNTLEFTATGTMAEIGTDGKWSDYRVTKLVFGMDFVIPACRMEMELVGPGIRKQHEIRVAAGKQAWDEEKPGIGGKPMPDRAAVERERLIWLTPQGAMWAAVMAGDKAILSNEAGRLVISYSIDDEPVKVLLNAQLQPERIEMQAHSSTYGNTVFVATYTGYKDFEGYLVPFPTKMTYKAGGRTILDLDVKSQISNPYVIFPKPSPMRSEAAAKPRRANFPPELAISGESSGEERSSIKGRGIFAFYPCTSLISLRG
jgi:hypothetical protein